MIPYKCTIRALQRTIITAFSLTTLAICLLNIYVHVHVSHQMSAASSSIQQDHIIKKLNVQAEKSAQILLATALSSKPILDEQFNTTYEAERCHKFNLNYTGRTKRRRVFYGSLIADDSWATIAISSIEHYGIFNTVAFVESNRTQSFYPRKIRFGNGTENLRLLHKLFGKDTRVSVDYYTNEDPYLRSLGREHDQRSLIIKRWKRNGMRPDDIGYLADVDEVLSRDFIRAMQMCDVNEFDHHQNCLQPKISAGTLVFEGGPDCLTSKRWFKLPLIIGECIDGIGNATAHPLPERSYNGKGWMTDGYINKTQFSSLPKDTTHYPLWNAADIRRHPGKKYGFEWTLYCGFHFHNFFPNIETLRRKYKTYGHAVQDAMEKSLGNIDPDLKPLIHCGLNKSSEDGKEYGLVEGGLEYFGSPFVPLAFQVPGYVKMRRQELKEILLKELEYELKT